MASRRDRQAASHGDPLERPPDLVLADVLDGKVSTEAAEADYGVVVRDGEVLAGDTTALRERLGALRGAVTWTYDRGPLGRD